MQRSDQLKLKRRTRAGDLRFFHAIGSNFTHQRISALPYATSREFARAAHSVSIHLSTSTAATKKFSQQLLHNKNYRSEGWGNTRAASGNIYVHSPHTIARSLSAVFNDLHKMQFCILVAHFNWNVLFPVSFCINRITKIFVLLVEPLFIPFGCACFSLPVLKLRSQIYGA
jgi:hypothetical protein